MSDGAYIGQVRYRHRWVQIKVGDQIPSGGFATRPRKAKVRTLEQWDGLCWLSVPDVPAEDEHAEPDHE